MVALSDHFTTEEFACHCGCGYGSLPEHISVELISKLERIRRMVEQPVHINSGCRCIFHNEEVGGAKNSAHLRGTAADLSINPWSGFTRYQLLVAAVMAQVHGIGVSNTFIHVDMDKTVPRPAAWGY